MHDRIYCVSHRHYHSPVYVPPVLQNIQWRCLKHQAIDAAPHASLGYDR